MVATTIGCAFGGWLYDVFIYTGPESPVNTPWMGLKRVVYPTQTWRAHRERTRKSEQLPEHAEKSSGDDLV